jgi:hypothetical protein
MARTGGERSLIGHFSSLHDPRQQAVGCNALRIASSRITEESGAMPSGIAPCGLLTPHRRREAIRRRGAGEESVPASTIRPG